MHNFLTVCCPNFESIAYMIHIFAFSSKALLLCYINLHKFDKLLGIVVRFEMQLGVHNSGRYSMISAS